MSEVSIHPSSVISSEAIIEKGVSIGPFCTLRGRVRIGANTHLHSNVSIGIESGIVEIGEGNQIYPGCVLGGAPQDKKYKGEPTRLHIGNNNHIREHVTISLATATAKGTTKIGNNNMVMAYCHFGHDCEIGDDNVFANASQLAGHVQIGNQVNVGGVCAFNQFVRVGDYAFLGGYSSVNKDILPYAIAQGNYAVMRATNKIGMERGGMNAADIDGLHKAIRIIIKGSSTLSEGLQRIHDECTPSPAIEYLIRFIKESKRGLAI
ncbi:MAG: acyl-ACP--UDP-N-acetylglucosamine O-acyltransferase [Bdellovibrionales bacterium CG10_big_fil_rev_8_21_14_0_10_45_34]|nr:MAG: acyl-ACP--UDP-N-acetylglucosamine O-acyltransferase [Bdellovibrionales bacterium CG10_big_fil_rev_8_21_14_0_10_45_34]